MGRPMQFQADEAVDRAVEVFWRQGYAATTPQGLATELGIAKGSLYNTFENKHSLFVLALRRYCDDRLKTLAEGLAAAGAVTPLLRDWMRKLAGVGTHERGCFAVNSTAAVVSSDAVVAQVARDLFAGIEAAFADVIARGQRDGELTAQRDAKEAAGVLVATVIGVSVLAGTGADTAQLDRTIDAALASL